MMPETDLLFLREAVIDLQAYIFSQDVYWPLRSKTPARLPQLTIGSLALAQARLSAAPLKPEQAKELEGLSARIQQVREEWLANWRKKGEREFASRLNLWQQYLRDLRGDARRHAPFFAREVRTRAILQLLVAQDSIVNAGEHAEQLAALDQVLRGVTQPGPFVWEEEVAPAFPPGSFWFLYLAVPAASN
jgi:hypothetical protein